MGLQGASPPDPHQGALPPGPPPGALPPDPPTNKNEMTPLPTPRQKIIWVRATSMGSKIGLLVIWMTAYKKTNLVYKWIDFSKFPQTWAKIGLDLRKLCDFAQNFAQN